MCDRKKKFVKDDKSQNETKSVGTTAGPRFYDKNSEPVGTLTKFKFIKKCGNHHVLLT
ncbi:hypothetical protein LEP1GSC132_0759 [Leptospira kirschneri str. 200803703]|uniref:Uncharacterized protein n=1 Tax=Leptospira kirschneri str. 200802841 TaxID=1193047 RepID=A0A828XT38_9LEPT|nr:hypothetical protein LEP1GSC131_1142 [Leptospira kirschneri str. 200802841]EKR07995.1 hypothetical protein LEP1GSC122_2003 [Leptospira kirschneri serovar Valbuzzi str. 200702274]EMJ89483.1 hypothetical protein LEP1GSC198_0475 [Leptospira kirschneri str. JB]EMO65963.1 hypothetical protein LEP1GSC132_0759 [Leptospira kirschneri str. 200803703]EMO75126.1 hypothetical protein LEP1GSC127_1583 [Leptospira kirschneri str. 200801925]EPG49045.1 hypothetical protein LEP1GSC049_1327 [Leptospira kirsch